MLSLGCIQARTCNTDHCPTGIATQNPSRNKAIVVTDKAQRVANFHKETITNLVELIGAAGLDNLEQLEPKHINRRVQGTDVKSYAQLYPSVTPNCLLDQKTVPDNWKDDWDIASSDSWS